MNNKQYALYIFDKETNKLALAADVTDTKIERNDPEPLRILGTSDMWEVSAPTRFRLTAEIVGEYTIYRSSDDK
jgi:hypothetical protein